MELEAGHWQHTFRAIRIFDEATCIWENISYLWGLTNFTEVALEISQKDRFITRPGLDRRYSVCSGGCSS